MALPPGERWFCDVFRDALPLITDDQLREDVRGFIGQEATHAKAHDLGLEHLARHGIDLRREVALGRPHPRPPAARAASGCPAWLQRRLLRNELAAIATIEHYTAVLGVWIVEADIPERRPGDARPAALARRRGGGAPVGGLRPLPAPRRQLRPPAPSTASIASVGILARPARHRRADHGARPDGRRGTCGYRAYRRAVRAGRFPALGTVVRSLREYLRRDYHPSRYGSTDVGARVPGHLARGGGARRGSEPD